MHERVLAGTVVVCLALVAGADVVKLKNGKTVDGIVTRETDKTVTINVGVGEVTVKRSQVAAIEKTGKAGRAAIEEEWKRHYSTHPRFVPKGWEDIAGDFTGIEQFRQSAFGAQKQALQYKADITRAMADLRSYEKELVALASQVSAMPPPEELKTMEEVAAYNKLIGRGNTLRSQRTLKESAIANSEEALAQATRVPAEYQRALRAFDKRYRERVSAGPLPTNNATFFTSIDTRLKGYLTEWQSVDISYEDTNNATIVHVKLNDTVSGRFILDTGASTVTISQDVANRLALDTAGQPTVTATVADGRKVTAVPIVLQSVQVGDARSVQVPAMILEQPPGPQIDGLLGMSFLREYSVHIDAQGHRLELSRLKGSR